jgi:curli biogenesis system outer membrane secretion channel CsgG
LGIGPQTQYSKDTVTISLRAISVNTGKVLAAVHVTKIVYSTADSVAVLKFLNNNTQAFEAETGLTINEPGTLAVKATIEAAVVELIKEGEKKGVWNYRKAMSQIPVEITPVTNTTVSVIKNEMPSVSPAVQAVPTTPNSAANIGLDPNAIRKK